MSSTLQTPSTPAQRFRLIIQGLLRSVGARTFLNLSTGGYPGVGMAALPAPLGDRISARFQRAAVLFAALAERVRLGTARTFPNRASHRRPPAPDRPPGVESASEEPASDTAAASAPQLPRNHGGVLGLLYWEAAHWAGQLRQLLADPETVTLLQSVPGFARILRPLCRMLAVVPPPGLFPPLPRRQRSRSRRRAIAPAQPPRAACSESPPHAGYVQLQPFVWARPRPAASERRPEAHPAGDPQKT